MTWVICIALTVLAIALFYVWLIQTAEELDPLDERGYSDDELRRARVLRAIDGIGDDVEAA